VCPLANLFQKALVGPEDRREDIDGFTTHINAVLRIRAAGVIRMTFRVI